MEMSRMDYWFVAKFVIKKTERMAARGTVD